MGLLFTADAHPAIASGDITVTFRIWKRAQVKVGGRYRVGDLTLVVDGLHQVRAGDIAVADLRRAGYRDLDALRA
ncbi:MAG: ASCH domain-containing protein, partial [Acidimicrobiia bacterium]